MWWDGDMLPYNEEDALRRILRHHGIDKPAAVTDLSALLDWVHQSEQAKVALRRGTEPMPLLSLLGTLGIYGKEAIDKVRAGEKK
jgi:hypothetical protein